MGTAKHYHPPQWFSIIETLVPTILNCLLTIQTVYFMSSFVFIRKNNGKRPHQPKIVYNSRAAIPWSFLFFSQSNKYKFGLNLIPT